MLKKSTTKKANQVVFSRKRNASTYQNLMLNNTPLTTVSSQKHLGLYLDSRLNFNDHLKYITPKVNQGIGMLRRLYRFVPRSALITIYKSSIRPNLDYADLIYDQPSNSTFVGKLESLQYQAALAITGAIKGSSREKIYNELGLESLSDRRWFRKLLVFYKIQKEKSPKYLFDLIPKKT